MSPGQSLLSATFFYVNLLKLSLNCLRIVFSTNYLMSSDERIFNPPTKHSTTHKLCKSIRLCNDDALFLDAALFVDFQGLTNSSK